MEKKMIPCTDQTIFIPYFDEHDVTILQGDTVSVQYYGHAEIQFGRAIFAPHFDIVLPTYTGK